jgi:hypothetical protein
MQAAPARTVFDVITDFLATHAIPRRLSTDHLPSDLQQRLDDLLDLGKRAKRCSLQQNGKNSEASS